MAFQGLGGVVATAILIARRFTLSIVRKMVVQFER